MVGLTFGLAILQDVAIVAMYGVAALGQSGPIVGQILSAALFVVLWYAVILGTLPFLASMLIWRLAIRVVGHPRMTAYGVAVAWVIAVAALGLTADLASITAYAGMSAFAYATIVRLPPVKLSNRAR